MARRRLALLLAYALAGSAIPAAAQDDAAESEQEDGWLTGEHEFTGYVAAEVRAFFDASAHLDQKPARVQPALLLQPEYRYDFNDGDDRLTLIPFVRLDATDRDRTHGDLREANWQHLGSDWDLTVGLGKVFWGVTESRHLVDIINQTDALEDPDEEDKLGQPLINLNYFTDWGTFGVFYMPAFRQRPFPGRDGRLRSAIPVDDDHPDYESDLRELHPDAALRWSHSIEDWDVGIYHFHGTGREPRTPLGVEPSLRPRLVPTYDIIDQTGLDVQLTQGAWLWKGEAISRWNNGDNQFFASVAGFEYTFFGVFESDADIGLLVEYLWDGRNSTAPVTSADNDVFGGVRLTMNDVDDTSFLIGVAVDKKTQATSLAIEAERRIGDDWKIELEASGFFGVPVEDVPLSGFRKDDFVQIRLFRFF